MRKPDGKDFEDMLKGDELVAAHFAATPLAARGSYAGKEHFWKATVEAGLSTSITSRLFQSVAFIQTRYKNPLLGRTQTLVQFEDPANHGIIVTTRSAVGMQRPPAHLAKELRSQSSRHLFHSYQEQFGNERDDVNSVIQVGSFIDFANRLDARGRLGKVTLVGMGSLAATAALTIAQNFEAQIAVPTPIPDIIEAWI